MKDVDKGLLAESQSNTGALLIAGAALAGVIKNPDPHGRNYVLVPAGMTLQDLERPLAPPRKTGIVKLADVDSFLTYFKAHAAEQSAIFGSMIPAQFVVVFDEHATDEADWREHRAILTLMHSVEWLEWTKRSGQPFDGNESFAIWLENNLVDVVDPDPAKLLEIALNMRVNQQQGLVSAVKLENGALNLEYKNEVQGSSTINARKVAIPEKFVIEVPVFSGLESPKYKVDARFRYKMNSGQLQLRFELVRPHKVVEQAFRDILKKVQEDTEREVLFGTPE